MSKPYKNVENSLNSRDMKFYSKLEDGTILPFPKSANSFYNISMHLIRYFTEYYIAEILPHNDGVKFGVQSRIMMLKDLLRRQEDSNYVIADCPPIIANLILAKFNILKGSTYDYLSYREERQIEFHIKKNFELILKGEGYNINN